MLMLARKFVNFILNTAGITHKSRNALDQIKEKINI